MKQKVLLLVLSMITISTNTYAQHLQEWTSEFTVSYGNYSDETVKVCVLVDIYNNDYCNAKYLFCTRLSGDFLPCSVLFNGQKELEQFHSSLKEIRNKYNEWLNIARQNNVKDLVKEIPIKTTLVELTLYDGNVNQLKKINVQLKGVFRAEFNSISLFPDDDSINIGIYSVTGMDIPIFHVCSVSDLDKIINALDITKIKTQINTKIQNYSFFNLFLKYYIKN